MTSTTRRIGPVVVIVLFLSQVVTGCGASEPVFVESGPPEARIVVKTDSWDNCDSASGVNQTFETRDSRSQETSWWFEGKAGIGGKIPIGFLESPLDIEASITSHYGGKETRTWESTYSYSYPVPAYTNSILAVFYQEITQKGIIQVGSNEIEYEYPAELTVLDHRKVDLSCEPRYLIYPMCVYTRGSPRPTVSPELENLAGTWRLVSPADGEIVKLDIDIQDNYFVIHTQTDGSSGVADWGTKYECYWSSPVEVTFDQLVFKTTKLTLRMVSGDRLFATAVEQYITNSVTIPPQTTEYIFKR